MAFLSEDSPLLVCDGSTGSTLLTLADDDWPKPSEPQDVQSNPALAWSRDGRQLLAATGAGIRVWEVQTGQVVIDHGAGWNDGDTLCGVGWGVTGPQLLTQELYGRARLWEVTTGEPAHELEGSVRWLRCAAWSPDGRVILAGDDHVTWIWTRRPGVLSSYWRVMPHSSNLWPG